MTAINHKQAKRYLRAAADGLLRDGQRTLLDAHLLECDSCRTEADELNELELRLKNNFQAKWDANDGPSRNVMTNIHSRSRRIIMTSRINTGLRAVAGIAAIIALGFVVNFTISQLKNHPVAANGTQNSEEARPADNSLIAFTSESGRSLDIYTMYVDGSNPTNLTNDPAYDGSPFWSPNGKRIAFESDRSGLPQIYLMDADGSNVTQVTDDEATHLFDYNFGRRINPWSPDGSKLLFLQGNPGDETWTLGLININGKNKISIVTGDISLNDISWSPDGSHIAFIAVENDRARIYSADADGNNLTNVTKLLPSDETLYPVNYSWSRDGQSISFIASNFNPNLGGDSSSSKWMAYEASLNGNTLNANAIADSQIGGYWDGTYFLSDSAMISSSPAFTWVWPKGTIITVNPLKNCENLVDSNTGGTTTGYSSYKQSSNGNLVIGANCPNGDKWLFWANSKGTVRPLLDSPIHVEGDTRPDMGQVPADFVWSPDDKYISFNIFSHGKTDMYIVNVAEALKDPSIQPLKITIGNGGNGSLYYSPSWRPMVNNDIVEEQLTPVPSPQTNKLIAFVSEKDGNPDIYSMYADGSELTNLTDNPAQDVSPVWSPDGKRIAFESDRDGYRQIYLMNADGSNVIQITHEKADHWIGEPYNLSRNLWSPDGKRLIFSQTSLGEDNGILYTIDANGENKKPLVKEAGQYSSPSWSPDGKHIAFIALENAKAPIYSTDADGNNLTKVTKLLPSDGVLYPMKYSWSRDGQSILFIALRGGSGDEGSSDYKWMAYEASLDGNTLVANATTNSQIGGYWDGTYFLSGSTLVSSSPAFTWVQLKGAITMLNPLKNCRSLLDSNTGSYITGYSSYKQSTNGNVIIGAYCPNGDKWLYWANSKGTVRPLLDSPIHVKSTPNYAKHSWAPPEFVWSPDDKYIAFNIFSSGKTDMYIVNVAEALKDPSTQPLKITIGRDSSGYSLYYSPAWQP